MDRHPRYEVVNRIAAGDFATVYHGFDKELNREVAIKQIHPQFLADPSKLDRYWKEAKLLASLEHPYIMTIYDIVRDRGWLILELMQGSLQQKLDSQPIDLEDLRLTIIYMSHALGFLHKNGIVHGDVKPSNLLLDKNHRVKLGDFGIARRLAGDDGSVLKGTTKYMAPEVVSDQFGPVGHHSDLYSLGFSSYELMCGEHFDSLFPGLHMFGRDPQIAWMMWHGAKDRSVPDIDKVLEGVPPEISRVVQKLCRKDPTERYLSSDEVIFDLKAHSEGKDPDELKVAEAEAELEQEKKQKKRRMYTYGALAASMLMSLLMLIPWGSNEPPAEVRTYPKEGVIATIDPGRMLIGVREGEGGDVRGLELNAERDRIFLNNVRSDFGSLSVGDEVEVEQVTTADNDTFFQIDATRQSYIEFAAPIVSIDKNNGTIQLDKNNNEIGEPSPIDVYIPTDLVIKFNGRDEWDGDTTRVRELLAGDFAKLSYVSKNDRLEARSIEVTRPISRVGILNSINRDAKELSIREGGEGGKLWTLPLGDDCRVTLNGIEVLSSGQQVSLADLHAGDEVTLRHDDAVRSIQAQREILSTGIVTRIDLETPMLTVELSDPKRLVAFRLAEDCLIGLESDGDDRPLSFIRVGDQVALEHDAPDFIDATAHAVQVTPLPNTGIWGIVIGFEQFDDQRVSTIQNSATDARLVHQELRDYYRIPDQQLKLSISPTKPGLRRELDDFLIDLPPNAQLIVYISSRSYVTNEGPPVMATRELDLEQLQNTGVTLADVLELLEPIETRETLLMLDICHPGSGEDLQEQPSVVEFAELSRISPIHPLSPTVTIIASSDKGEVNRLDRTTGFGLFAQFVAAAFHGGADADGDHFVDSDELMLYLENRFGKYNEDSRIVQNPIRFLPDPTPIRIAPETREAVVDLLGFLSLTRYDPEVAIAFQTAERMQPEQPDAEIVFALVNLKHDRTSQSRTVFERVKVRHPEEIVPRICLAWQHFMSKETAQAVDELQELVDLIGQPRDEEEAEFFVPLLRAVGEMQVYATEAAEVTVPLSRFKEIEAKITELGPAFVEQYEEGKRLATEKMAEIDLQLETAAGPAAERLRRDRTRMVTYLRMNYDLLSDYVRYRLDH